MNYLIRRGSNGHYLQWHPAPSIFEFTAAEQTHATVFSLGAACVLAAQFRESDPIVYPDDYQKREAKFDVATLPRLRESTTA